MKRFPLILGFVTVAIALGVWLFPPGDGPAPRFVPGAPANIPQFQWNHYNWSDDAPFQNGRMWVWLVSTGAVHTYVLDLNRRVVEGQLVNTGPPVLWTRDGSKLLCSRAEAPGNSPKERLLLFLSKVTGRPPPWFNRIETFWLLDRKSNSAKRLGSVSQASGGGSSWHPCPDFSSGYTVPSTARGTLLVLCNLEKQTFQSFNIDGFPTGWWDERHIMIRSPGGEFSLLNVARRETRLLFGTNQVMNLLSDIGLTNGPSTLGARTSWNGADYDFYFGPVTHIAGLTNEPSFLLKADKENNALRLVSSEFQYRWGASFDVTGTRYLFQGEQGGPGKGGDGGVYLRDLNEGTVATLVPPDYGGQYAIPRFYSNEVIFFRNRVLHRVSQDGGSIEPLLSPTK